MKAIITGQEPFKSLKGNFTVGPSKNGYTLSYSVDKKTWTDYTEATPAGENCMVVNCVAYTWFRLTGNSGEVTIIL